MKTLSFLHREFLIQKIPVEQNFLREFQLLDQTIKDNPDKTLVYFSTCSVEDEDLQNAPYVIHKKAIEKFIKENVAKLLSFQGFKSCRSFQ